MNFPVRFWARLSKTYHSQNKFLWLLVSTLLLITINPYLPSFELGKLLSSGLFTAVVLSGIYSVRNQRRLLRQILMIGIFSIALDLASSLPLLQDHKIPVLGILLYTGFLSLVTINLIRQVALSQEVTADVIYGAIAGYLLIGLTAGLMATAIEMLFPGSFELSPVDASEVFPDLLYFSFITLSTIGYGDITPSTSVAQSFAMVLGVSGQIYLTVLIALLIGKYLGRTLR